MNHIPVRVLPFRLISVLVLALMLVFNVYSINVYINTAMTTFIRRNIHLSIRYWSSLHE